MIASSFHLYVRSSHNIHIVQIVMQISHVLCKGAKTGKKANCGKSARRDIELTW